MTRSTSVRDALRAYDTAPRAKMKPAYDHLRAVCLHAGMPWAPFRVVQWARDHIASLGSRQP